MTTTEKIADLENRRQRLEQERAEQRRRLTEIKRQLGKIAAGLADGNVPELSRQNRDTATNIETIDAALIEVVREIKSAQARLERARAADAERNEIANLRTAAEVADLAATALRPVLQRLSGLPLELRESVLTTFGQFPRDAHALAAAGTTVLTEAAARFRARA